MDVLESVQYGDLTTEQKDTVDLIGMDAFLFLVEKCGGTNLYIPKKETVGRTARNAKIRAEFTGQNLRALAGKYGLSEVQIRTILAKKD